MAISSAAPHRYMLVDNLDSIIISIPVDREGITIIILITVLGVWANFENGLIHLVWRDGNINLLSWLFVLLLFVGWTCLGVFPIYALLYQLIGKELVLANSQQLQVKYAVAGFGVTRNYLVSNMRTLRSRRPLGVGEVASDLVYAVFAPRGAIVFDYDSKPVYIASGIDQTEAAAILDLLKQRFSYDVRTE